MQAMRTFVLALTLAVVLAFTSEQAWAHAYVDRSSPAEAAELGAAPSEIRVWFTEGIEVGFSTLRLKNQQGEYITGTRQTNEGDLQLILHIPPIPHGIYTVEWQVLSKDTHVTNGSFDFAVGVSMPGSGPVETPVFGPTPSPQPTPAPEPAPTPAPAPEPAPQPTPEPAPAPAPAPEPKPAPTPTPTLSPEPSTEPEPATEPAANADEAAEPPASDPIAPPAGGTSTPPPAPAEQDAEPESEGSNLVWVGALAGLVALFGGVFALRRKAR